MLPSGSLFAIGGGQLIAQSLFQPNSGLLGGVQDSFNHSSPLYSSLFSPQSQFNPNGLLDNFSNTPFLSHSFSNDGGLPMAPMNQNPLTSRQHCGIQNDLRQFSASHGQQQIQGGLRSIIDVAPVMLEPQMCSYVQSGPAQQLKCLQNVGSIRMEPENLDPALLSQQQQQLSRRQSSQTASKMSLLEHQQMMLQMQQLQQRFQLPQLLHQQSLSVGQQVKPTGYELGACAGRLTHYMYHQRHRPEDNKIEYWRNLVAQYFAPNAKKRWCFSHYGTGQQTYSVIPQKMWHCEICKRKPSRGFETTAEVLPRLCQIEYASGTLEELLYVEMPHEYLTASGQIVLNYSKAIQESVFEQLRVVRYGQLRIVFNQDLKIASWEFCTQRHEAFFHRNQIRTQAKHLGEVVNKYHAAAQNTSSNLSEEDLQNVCNSFVASARHLAKALEVPSVDEFGYTKSFILCLKISDAMNSLKDLIDYGVETGNGPMDSLSNFTRKRKASPGNESQQTKQPEEEAQKLNQCNTNLSCLRSSPIPVASSTTSSNGVVGMYNLLGAASSTCVPTTSSSQPLQQNSMNKREKLTRTISGPYGGNTVQVPSAAPVSSNNIHAPSSHEHSTILSTAQQPAMQTHNENDPMDCQSSVQRILQEVMLSSLPNTSTPNSYQLLHQKSMNSIQEKQINTISIPYDGGNAVQIPSTHPPFSSNDIPAPAYSTNSYVNLFAAQQPAMRAHNEADPIDSQSSVQRILREVMLSPHLNELKEINGISTALSRSNCLAANAIANDNRAGGRGF